MYYNPPNFSPVNLQISNFKHVFSIIAENSVDSDQMASFCVEKKRQKHVLLFLVEI